MTRSTITPVEREWLKLNTRILKKESELFSLKNELRSIKPDVLKALGYCYGIRDETVTGRIHAKAM
jgi:hypothetical protein